MGTDNATPGDITSKKQVRDKYRSHRYLQDLSNDALYQFGRDVWRNFMTVNSSAKAAPLPSEHRNHFYWRVRLLHFMQEMEFRFGAYTAGMEGIRNGQLPNPKSVRVRAAIAAVDYSNLIDGTYLVRYGRRDDISAMLEHGLVRLKPASTYASPLHNDAVHDIELQFTHHLHNPSADVLGRFGARGYSDPKEGSLYLEGYVERDYYMLCLSATYDPCLFDDFNADSCLLIRDPREFRDRLLRAAESSIPNRGRGYNFGTVTYVDPFSEPDLKLPYCMRKHHRFMYQDEVRAAWEVLPSTDKLTAHPMRLGAIDDIAEAVYL